MKLFLMWEVPFLVHIKTSKFIFPTLAAAGIGEGSTAKSPSVQRSTFFLKWYPQGTQAGRCAYAYVGQMIRSKSFSKTNKSSEPYRSFLLYCVNLSSVEYGKDKARYLQNIVNDFSL